MIPILPVSTEFIEGVYAPVRQFKSRIRMTVDNPDVDLTDTFIHDFADKLVGNTISNPSNAKYRTTTGVIDHWNDFTVEATHDQYNRLRYKDDGLTWAISNTTLNMRVYMYYGFDIIGILTRQYGENLWQGKTAIADRIAIAKEIITRLTVSWHGYGSHPTGNKATLQTFSVSQNAWDAANEAIHTASVNTTMSVTSLSSYSSNTPANKIDTSGFFHAMIKAEASDGVGMTRLQADYVSLEIDTNIGHYDDDTLIRMSILEEISILNEALPSNELELTLDNSSGDFDFITFQNMHKILASKPKLETELGLVLIDEPEEKVIRSDFSGKIRASFVENPHSYLYRYGSTMYVPTDFTAEVTQAHYDAVTGLDDYTSYLNAGTTSGYRAQGLFTFDIIAILTQTYGNAIWRGKTSIADKVAIAESLIPFITVKWSGYGASPAGNKVTMELWSVDTGAWDTANLRTHTSNTPTELSINISRTYASNVPHNKIDANGLLRLHVFAEPATGTTANSFVRTDDISIEITVSPVNEIEWKPTGTFFITEWKNDVTSRIVSVVANDYFALLADISYEPTTITNLRSLAIDVLTKGGVPTDKQIVDLSLSSITVNPFVDRTDIRTALQNIGIVGTSCVGQDRYGNVFIKPFLTIDQVSNYVTYPTTQPVVYGGYTSPTMYPINNTAGGMKYLDYEQMYEPPEVSLEKSIYQLGVKYYPTGAGGDSVELIYTNTFIEGTNGQSFTIDNPLVKTVDQANKISAWYIREINYNAFYVTKWRQNPALEATDIILVEDAFGAEKQTRIIRSEINYEGFLDGITESRGGV